MMFKRASLALAAAAVFSILTSMAVQARTVTLDKWMPTVRLCPVSCISVSGHKMRNGSKVEVLQVRNGWARVSPWLDAQKLKRSFGERVPEKPAYWIELRRTRGVKVARAKSGIPAEPKSVSAYQQKRVTLPVARPTFFIAGLQAAENSMIVNALATDPRETAKVSHAALANAEATTTPVAINAPANQSEQALTTDKMAEWIAANRGDMIEDVKESAAIAEPEVPVTKGKALETQIIALKTSDESSEPFGVVPDVMTSELLDRRLNILPGMNSKIPEETVIALRHYALGLLNSKACKGIAGGGAGEKSGTIYLVCTDDLTRMREFSVSQGS